MAAVLCTYPGGVSGRCSRVTVRGPPVSWSSSREAVGVAGIELTSFVGPEVGGRGSGSPVGDGDSDLDRLYVVSFMEGVS